MSENLEPQLDARVRTALRDLDRRVEQHVHSAATRTARGPAPARTAPERKVTRRLAPALAGCTVVALLITVGWLAGPGEPSVPADTPPASTVSTPAPTDPNAPSQSPADAARDGVNRLLARLPVSRRVAATEPIQDGSLSQVSGPEGTWVISRPDTATIGDPDTSCVARKGQGSTRYDVCYGYSEILLMTPDLKRILRAYPIPSLPAQWLVLTPEALYCGRQGDGAIPDSMVCRIDRSTLRFTGRVFPFKDAVDASAPKTFKGWPGAWSNNAPTGTGFDRATLTGGALKISDVEGKPTITLNPATLKPRP
jgi:hypothetical protein